MKHSKYIVSVLLVLLAGFSVLCLTYQDENAAKIDPEIKNAFAEGNRTVAVHIWMSDIDQDSVDAEVKEKTGLTNKTQGYMTARRALAREKMVEKNTAFVKTVHIEEDAIIFQSAYAPMVIAELTERQVKKISKRSDVASMCLYHEARFVAE